MMIEDTVLAGLPILAHGFFTRLGGVSAGPFASLNCAWTSGDDLGSVKENRARVARRLGVVADALLTCKQVHGKAVVEVATPFAAEARPDADALVTRVPGLAIGVLTADCAPVLFADPTAKVIGAAHAGWRGALSGIVESTVAAMARLGAAPSRTLAVVGPCIQQDSYEVGAEFRAAFLREDTGFDRFFLTARREGHFMFDLSGFVARRLTAAGIGQVRVMTQDTAADELQFFSFRRSTLRAEKSYGGQISAIALRDKTV